MIFVSIHTLDGNPYDLLQRKRSYLDPAVRELAPEHGALFSVTVRRSNGRMIINGWESPQGAAVFTQLPQIQAAQQASGLPLPSSFERFTDGEVDVYGQMSPSGG